jgi:inhibitor of cysteine peptidase
MQQVTRERNGEELKIALGEQFEIELAENPTTGYRWHFLSTGGPVLDIQEDSFQSTGAACGAGGMRRWRLRALQMGTTQLAIEHRRSWETHATETFVVHVLVTAK